jgi:hypothetical protein
MPFWQKGWPLQLSSALPHAGALDAQRRHVHMYGAPCWYRIRSCPSPNTPEPVEKQTGSGKNQQTCKAVRPDGFACGEDLRLGNMLRKDEKEPRRRQGDKNDKRSADHKARDPGLCAPFYAIKLLGVETFRNRTHGAQLLQSASIRLIRAAGV